MTRTTPTPGEIFENIIFLAEVFGDRRDEEIPKIPILEMAQCFKLKKRYAHRAEPRRGRMDWSLWN